MDAERVLWVTGAGSGMGRAVAVAAAARGWRVALSGRRAATLTETARIVSGAGGQSLSLPLDARDTNAITRAHERILATWDLVPDLVLAAGLNAPPSGIGMINCSGSSRVSSRRTSPRLPE